MLHTCRRYTLFPEKLAPVKSATLLAVLVNVPSSFEEPVALFISVAGISPAWPPTRYVSFGIKTSTLNSCNGCLYSSHKQTIYVDRYLDRKCMIIYSFLEILFSFLFFKKSYVFYLPWIIITWLSNVISGFMYSWRVAALANDSRLKISPARNCIM